MYNSFNQKCLKSNISLSTHNSSHSNLYNQQQNDQQQTDGGQQKPAVTPLFEIYKDKYDNLSTKKPTQN